MLDQVYVERLDGGVVESSRSRTLNQVYVMFIGTSCRVGLTILDQVLWAGVYGIYFYSHVFVFCLLLYYLWII
jgi:hypothetical protein